MIGIIGPKDAVESLYAVAVELGREHLIIKGTYRSVHEAPDLARSLDAGCDVLLFTGRVPHRLAAAAHAYRAKLHYVPDGPIDLYRAMALLSVDSPIGSLSFSMDTVSRAVVEEVFTDLNLPSPAHIMPLDDIAGDWHDIGSLLIDFHRRCYESGEVSKCVTWLGQVYDELSEAGIPVRRVTHSHATYRETLIRAELADSAARSEASQVTAALIRPTKPSSKRSKSKFAGELAQFGERLQGRLVPLSDDDTYLVYTTRGVLEAELSRVQSGFSETLAPASTGWQVGYGVGASAVEAANLAERAMRRGSDSAPVHVLYADGTALTVDMPGQTRPVQLRIASDKLEADQAAPLRPYSMDRLIAAVRGLDPAGFTAKQFATAYGVQERSARRILGSLESAELATRSGIQTSPGAGRPNTVYTVDLEKILSGATPSDNEGSRP